MKFRKFFVMSFLVCLLAITSFADTPLDPNCKRGHIDSPVYMCEPPPTSLSGQSATADDSTLTMIKLFIIGFNPFVPYL